MAQNVPIQDIQLKALGPSLFARVKELEGINGLDYEIEILAGTTGYRVPFFSVPFTDTQAGKSDGNGFQRVAACVLLMLVQRDSNTGRIIIDGKIEELWLRGEGKKSRLPNVQLLATLLGYVQKFCTDHQEIAHLSITQKTDHPDWFKDFFLVAGFNRCEHLRPEAASKGQRTCLKLGDTPRAPAAKIQNGTSTPSTGVEQGDSKSGEGKAVSLPTNTVAGAADNAAIASEMAPAKSIKSTLTEPVSDNHALEWMSQNKEILSSATALAPKEPPALTSIASSSSSKPIDMTRLTDREPGGNSPTREKRKRLDTETQNGDNIKRRVRSRSEVEPKELEVKKQAAKEEIPRPKSTAPSKLTQPTVARYSFSMANGPAPNPKAKTDQSNLTDALLARVDQAAPSIGPKTIKKEPTAPATSSQTPYSPGPDPHPYRPYQTTGSKPPLTCFYWANHGHCKHRDEDCLHAHYDTGTIANKPGSYKGRYRRSSFGSMGLDGAGDPWSGVNGSAIRGRRGAPAAPTGPKGDYGRDGEGYDSYRPH